MTRDSIVLLKQRQNQGLLEWQGERNRLSSHTHDNPKAPQEDYCDRTATHIEGGSQ